MQWWAHSSFLACLFLWMVNEKVRNRWRGVDELYAFYLSRHTNGQTHVCLIASSLKMITKRVAVVYWFKSARLVSVILRPICMFLGCDELVLSSKYSNWKIVLSCTDSCHGLAMKYVAFYAWTKRLTHFSTCNLPIQQLVYVNKHLTTSIIKY